MSVGRTRDMGVWRDVNIHKSANPQMHHFLKSSNYSNKKWKREGRKEKGNEGRYRRGKINGKENLGK